MGFDCLDCLRSRKSEENLDSYKRLTDEKSQELDELRRENTELKDEVGRLRKMCEEMLRQIEAHERGKVVFSENTKVTAEEEASLKVPVASTDQVPPACYDNPIERNEQFIDSLIWTMTRIVKDRNGTLIVLQVEEDAAINSWATLAKIVNRPLDQRELRSVFCKENPLHDGAVVVRLADQPMLFAANVFAPLEAETPTTREHVFGKGSRHRAAREFSAQSKSNVLVIVASEQNSTLSVARGGKLSSDLSLDALRESVRSWIYHNWRSNGFRTGEATYAFTNGTGMEPPNRRPTPMIDELDQLVENFEAACPCGVDYQRNNVHYFCDWLIRNGRMEPKLAGCYCCPAGRPVRAKELREHYFLKRLKRTFTPPAHNAFVYSEKNYTGHVHYGGHDYAVVGATQPDEYFEYYF